MSYAPEPMDDADLADRTAMALRRANALRVQQDIRAYRLAVQQSAPQEIRGAAADQLGPNHWEQRHQGPDGGLHHRVTQLGPGVPGRPEGPCPCDVCQLQRGSTDDSSSYDPTAYDRAFRETRARLSGVPTAPSDPIVALRMLGIGGVGHEPADSW